jgi:hypothetical protein
MEWKVLTIDKTIESTFVSDAEPQELIAELSASTSPDTEPIGYFYYSTGLFEQLIVSSSTTDNIRVLSNEQHYEMFLADESASMA